MKLSVRYLAVLAVATVVGIGTIPVSAPVFAAGGGGDSSSSRSSSSNRSADKTAKRYKKAVKKIKKGDYDDAVELLDKVVKKQPNNADAHNYLGYSHRKLGDVQTAYQHYARALQIDPLHKGALEYLGELYLETGDVGNAQAMLARLERACPNGCEEKEELSEKIADQNAKTGG